MNKNGSRRHAHNMQVAEVRLNEAKSVVAFSPSSQAIKLAQRQCVLLAKCGWQQILRGGKVGCLNECMTFLGRKEGASGKAGD